MEDERQVIDLEATPVETPQGADTAPQNEGEQEAANDSNIEANNFNTKIYELIQEYQAKIPLNFMMKILSAIQIDLQSALLGTNMTWLENKLRESMQPEESKITLA